MTTDLYKIFGVSPKATDSEIRMAYHALERQYHPAVEKIEEYKSSAARRKKEFAAIREAYEILIDPEKRQEYDQTRQKTSSQKNKNDAPSTEDEEVTDNEEESEDEEYTENDQEDDEDNEEYEEDEESEEYGEYEEDGKEYEEEENNQAASAVWAQIAKKLFGVCLGKSLGGCLLIIIYLLAASYYHDFSHKYTLISTLTQDTNIQIQTDDGQKTKKLTKGTVVEVLSTDDNAKWVETSEGKIRAKHLSPAKNGYIKREWVEVVTSLLILMLPILLTKALFQTVAILSAKPILRQYMQTHPEGLNTNNIIYGIKKSASTLKAAIIVLVTGLIIWPVTTKLDTAVISYALSSGDNSFLNALLELYQAHSFLFICIVFLLIDLVLCFIVATASIRTYTCPFCNAPFSFFFNKEFETNITTYNKTEYHLERRGNRDVQVPYLVAYRNYDLHTIHKCSVCGKKRETVQNKTDQM